MGKFERIEPRRHPPTTLTRLERAVRLAEQESLRHRKVATKLPPKEPDAPFDLDP